jgi:hypothetical protein
MRDQLFRSAGSAAIGNQLRERLTKSRPMHGLGVAGTVLRLTGNVLHDGLQTPRVAYHTDLGGHLGVKYLGCPFQGQRLLHA